MHEKTIPGYASETLPDSQVVARLTKKLHAVRLLHSCMTCEHFVEHELQHATHGEVLTIPAETCGLYQTRPPARVIAYGCLSWTDGLPF